MKALLTLVAFALGAPALVAQGDSTSRPARLVFEEGARVGQRAPAIVLPYATQTGAGPADQPFSLAKELGHVVVLVFYGGDSTAIAEADWRGILANAGGVFAEDVVVAGIAPDPLEAHVGFAGRLGLPFKLLADRNRLVTRRWGLTAAATTGTVVVVVDRLGMVRYVNPRFAAGHPASYVPLGAAVRAAREKP